MFAIIDIETTGINFRYGKITEIAIFQHNGTKITGSFSSLIYPEMDISFHIIKIIGITNSMVNNAPKFYEIAKKIIEMTVGRIFVAYNVQFDYKFIKEEYKRLGFDFKRKTIYTVKIAKKLLPGFPSYSLGKICTDLNIELIGRHRAEGDALATVRLFELLLQKNEWLNRQKVGENRLLL